jgi:hypothetical protein
MFAQRALPRSAISEKVKMYTNLGEEQMSRNWYANGGGKYAATLAE